MAEQIGTIPRGEDPWKVTYKRLLQEYRNAIIGLIEDSIAGGQVPSSGIFEIPSQLNQSSFHHQSVSIFEKIAAKDFYQLRVIQLECVEAQQSMLDPFVRITNQTDSLRRLSMLVDAFETILYRVSASCRDQERTEEVNEVLQCDNGIRDALNTLMLSRYNTRKYEKGDALVIKPFKYDLLRAAGNRDLGHLSDLLDPADHTDLGKLSWVDNDEMTPLHVVVDGGETKRTTKILDRLLTFFRSLESKISLDSSRLPLFCPQNVQSFLDKKDKEGNTALHLAAQNESVEVVKWLCRAGARVDLTDGKGTTALELMYVKTPEAVGDLLSQNMSADTSYSSDGKLKVNLDFSHVIGWGGKKDGKYAFEMGLLALIVYGNAGKTSSNILLHPIVKIFLELKWKKMSLLIYMMSIFYILVHLFYTSVMVKVLVISFPPNGGVSKNNCTFSEFLLGSRHNGVNFNPIMAATRFAVEKLGDFSSPPVWGVGFLCLSVFLGLLEIWELWIFIRKMLYDTRIFEDDESRCDLMSVLRFSLIMLVGIILLFLGFENEVLSLCVFGGTYLVIEIAHCIFRCCNFRNIIYCILNGLRGYLQNLENVLQLIFICLMAHVYTMDIESGNLRETDYINGALGIILAYTLILFQFMNIFGFAKYVLMLKTVTQSFLKTMLAYISLLLGFCLSYSILFYEDRLFETLPQSLFRVLPMMGGEFNWDDTFNKESEEGQASPPRFYLSRHFLQVSFNIVVTIVLINLLIGLTVGDLNGIVKKSDLAQRSIQVERLYIMENIVFFFTICLPTLLDRILGLLRSIIRHIRPRNGETTLRPEEIALNERGRPNTPVEKDQRVQRRRPRFSVLKDGDFRMSRLPIKCLSLELQRDVRQLLADQDNRASKRIDASE